MSRNDEKKTAIKLLNKYADSYNLLEEENKSLRKEIRDLRENLNINKEIIEGFFSHVKNRNINALCTDKLKEENKNLYAQIESLTKERNEIRAKLVYIEQTVGECLNREREENEKNKTKLFVMENALLKKDGIILQLKKRLERINEDQYYSNVEREIFIIEPSLAVNQIHDELQMYHQIFENLSGYIKDTKESIRKYEILINDLQNENSKLRTKYKMQVLSAKREKDNYIAHAALSPNPRTATEHTRTKSNQLIKLEQNIIFESRTKLNNQSVENEEFFDILKSCGLSQYELEKLSRNKDYSRLIEALEMLCALINDKNLSISVLESENASLNSKNNNLNQDNMTLIQENFTLKKQLCMKKNISLNQSLTNDTVNLRENENVSEITKKSEKNMHENGCPMEYYAKQEGKKEGFPIMNTFESVTLSEFKEGLGQIESFVSIRKDADNVEVVPNGKKK